MKTKQITMTAMGIALYAVFSMTVKIPIIGHIALDLGYVVLGIYAYCIGPIPASLVGAGGAAIISTLTGWFAPGWVVGNFLIGFFCGVLFSRRRTIKSYWYNIMTTIVFVAVGILGVKTVVECTLYSIPYPVKIPKNAIATVVDSIVMCIGVFIAQKFQNTLTKGWR